MRVARIEAVVGRHRRACWISTCPIDLAPMRMQPFGMARSARLTAQTRARIDELKAEFGQAVAAYDAAVPFVRVGQFESHHATIRRRRELGGPVEAMRDPTFLA